MDVMQRDHIKNVDIRANLGIAEDIVERIQARRLRYFGHVVRMDQHRQPNIALYGRVEGKRHTDILWCTTKGCPPDVSVSPCGVDVRPSTDVRNLGVQFDAALSLKNVAGLDGSGVADGL